MIAVANKPYGLRGAHAFVRERPALRLETAARFREITERTCAV
jgi:hypothetical protein